MTGRWTALAARPVRFAEWLFGPLAPGVDLGLMLIAAGWAMLEVLKPQLFDRGAFVGMSWVADPIWFAIHVMLVTLHGMGLLRPHWRMLRFSAAFLSSWHWLVVALSLLRVEMNTGVLAYGLLGLFALFSGIYLAGVPRKAV
ncbi:hypothetical protein [Methylorubrum zatmanii]